MMPRGDDRRTIVAKEEEMERKVKEVREAKVTLQLAMTLLLVMMMMTVAKEEMERKVKEEKVTDQVATTPLWAMTDDSGKGGKGAPDDDWRLANVTEVNVSIR
jgi:hypothetical protein